MFQPVREVQEVQEVLSTQDLLSVHPFLGVLGNLAAHHDHLDLAASHTGGRSLPC